MIKPFLIQIVRKEKIKEEQKEDKESKSRNVKRIYETHSVQQLDLNKLPMEEDVQPKMEIDETVLAILKINFSKAF